MRNLIIALTITLIFSACSENGRSYKTKFWIGSYDAMDESEEVTDMAKEIQGKLDVLNLIGDDSFSKCQSFSIVNEESTSTFEIILTDADTTKIEDALAAYMFVIKGAYNIKVIEEPHAIN